MRAAQRKIRHGGLLSALLISAMLTSVLLSSGCTSMRDYVSNGFKVGPNYRQPAAPVAHDWINGDHVPRRAATDQDRYWWTILNDPTLNGLISNAYQQNLSLREAGFRVLQARAARAIAAGYLFPQQQYVAGDYTRNALSRSTANSIFLPVRFFDQWDLGFNLAWELDFWGRFRRALEAADADLDVFVESYDQVLVTLLGDVAATYVEVRTLQQQIELVRTNITLQRETYTIANARFRGGQVSSLDVDQSVSTLAQTEALLPQFQTQLRSATDRLCILLGIPPEDLIKTIGERPIPTAPPDIAIGIPADLLTRRPDVRAAEREVAAESARVGVATSELYPHIGITGTVGYSAEHLSQLLRPKAFEGAAGPYFQWNVLNYGRLYNEIKLHDARLAELIATYQNTVLKANAEVEDGLAEFLNAQQRAKSLAISVEASKNATNVALVQYKAGMVDFNRVSLIEQNLVQQQDLLTQAQGNIALGLIHVYRALGGGWQIRLNPAAEALPIAPPAPAPAPAGVPHEAVPAPRALIPQPAPADPALPPLPPQ